MWSDSALDIRAYTAEDRRAVVALWQAAGLLRPWNDPERDIDLCCSSSESEIFVGVREDRAIAAIMVGHDGHRGWLYYLAVDPGSTGQGFGRRMVEHAEGWLASRGVPKVHIMIRETNLDVQAFYRRLGYEDNPCRVMQRWLDPAAGARAAPKTADPGAGTSD